VILVDTGPLVAVFDPLDPSHARCVDVLRMIREPLFTTVPVLTEAFYMLQPESIGSDGLREMVGRRGLAVWFFQPESLSRAFELMAQYQDHPMDFADASLVAAAEHLGVQKIFTIDRNHFATYRVRRGHRHVPLEIVS
jgi:predicted nucleic acid-binding protein